MMGNNLANVIQQLLENMQLASVKGEIINTS